MASAVAGDALAQEVTVLPKRLKTVWEAPSSDSDKMFADFDAQGTSVIFELVPTHGVILDVENIKLQIGGSESRFVSSSRSRALGPWRFTMHSKAISLTDAEQKVKLEGTLSVLVASKSSTIVSGMVTWVPNTKIAFDPSTRMPEITLGRVENFENHFGVPPKGTNLELEIQGAWQREILSEFKVLPKKGLPILMDHERGNSFPIRSKANDCLTLSSERPLEDGNLQITFWTDAKWIEVPVSLMVGGTAQ